MQNNLRLPLVLLVWSFVVGTTATALGNELYSGPQPGETLTELMVQRVYGPADGVRVDLARAARTTNSMLIFVNGTNRPAAELTRTLINYAEMQPREELFAATIWIADDRSAAHDYLRKAISWWGTGLPTAISTDGNEGPGAYGLNRQVNVTILLSRKNQVAANFALVQPSVTDAPRIIKALSGLVKCRVPNTDELRLLAMPTRKPPEAPWVAATKDVGLRRHLCRLLATDDDASATAMARRLNAYVSDRRAARKQLSRLSGVLSEGRRRVRSKVTRRHIRAWKTSWKDEDDSSQSKWAPDQVREAASTAIQLVERTSAKFLETRQCFTCHTQTMAAMVLTDARRAGFEIDERNLRQQVERSLTLYEELDGVRVDTVGYGLWTLDVGQYRPDAMTEAMVEYILQYKKGLGHWEVTVDRPPAEASDFTTNYVALRGLRRYGVEGQQTQIAARIGAMKRWLATAVAIDTEDHVFLLRLARELNLSSSGSDEIVAELKRRQRDDGGWAQQPSMQPDAYATGSVLVVLHEVGVPSHDPTWQRGLGYLLRSQQPDGSWRVTTHSVPMQEYFESGFPYAEDQFISTYATGWATKALLLALRETHKKNH